LYAGLTTAVNTGYEVGDYDYLGENKFLLAHRNICGLCFAAVLTLIGDVHVLQTYIKMMAPDV
jgi:hypothetical protein